ncbi:MAG: L,D-transpeptidase [Bacteroidota bacterium]
MLRNVLYISASIVIFFVGLIAYGIILNLREESLEETLKEKGLSRIENVKLVISRKNYHVELYSNKLLIKSYKAVFGKNNSTIKTSKNDLVTPMGDYKICAIDTNSKFHKYLHLNYPNDKDAAEALKQGYIVNDEFDAINLAYKKNECPPEETALGSNIGIHGIGEYDFIFRNLPFTFNWTDGSVAVSNKSIDELFSVVKIGTPVKITY